MKTNTTKRLKILSSCLILVSTLGVFACKSSGKSTIQQKTDDTPNFTASSFDQNNLTPGALVTSKITVPAGIAGKVHVDIISDNSAIASANKSSCDLLQLQSCDVVFKGIAEGTTFIKFKSGSYQYNSAPLVVTNTASLSFSGLEKGVILINKTEPLTVSFPKGIKLDGTVTVNVTTEPNTAASVTGSPCSLSTDKSSCTVSVTGNKATDKVTISAKTSDGKYSVSKDIRVTDKPTIYIRDFTEMIAGSTSVTEIGLVSASDDDDTKITISSDNDIATVELDSADCIISNTQRCTVTALTKHEGTANLTITSASGFGTATKTLKVLPFIKNISGSFMHTCATDADNQTYCWGSNASGQLGNGKGGDGTGKGNSLLPIKIAQEYSMTKISVRSSQSIALAADGSIYGWGQNGAGQLGIGEPRGEKPWNTENLPQKAISSSKFTTLSSGGRNTCAIDSDQKLYCWGSNDSGLNGNNIDDGITLVTTPTRVQSDVNFITLFEGDHTACAISVEGKLYCWGHNDYGQINATRKNVLVPTIVDIPGVNKVIKVALGYTNTCALSDTHDAYCWGLNTYGQNGDGTKTQPDTPKLVLGGLKFIDLAASHSVTCGITDAGAAYCWGQANIGTLGDGKTSESTTPVMVKAPGIKFVNLSVYSAASTAGDVLTIEFCGATDQGKAYCWGDNDLGQLGTGTVDVANSPVAVKF